MKTPELHRISNGSGLLTKLLSRGDKISIVQGELFIKSSSGLAIPRNWLKTHETLLINDICNLFNITALRYESYSTGSYGIKKSEGITLQFNNLKTNEGAYLIFNASLKRTRNSSGGKKGERLPGKQFIVSERSSFYKFWLTTALTLPRSRSKFYECMGKLKSFIFTAEIDFNNRIIDKKITLLDISNQDILARIDLNFGGKHSTNLTAKEPLRFHQGTAKEPLRFTAKDIEGEYDSISLQPNQSTCASKYGNTVIRKEVISKGASSGISPSNTINNREVGENIIQAKPNNKRPEDMTTDEWLSEWENSFATG